MPRIKAITTGSIPSFLDVILNFAESDTTSTLATQDTWLAQMKAKDGGKMVMYGDDTWLKLFPETFDRADGTSSFFVAVSQFKSVVYSIELNTFVRTLRKWTTMLLDMSHKSSNMMIGTQWYCIILALIILVIKPVHEGMRTCKERAYSG
jgi:ethanolaminephosphotransferase